MSILDMFKKKPIEAANNQTEQLGAIQTIKPIGKKQLEEATNILKEYKDGKANLENRVVENDKWYRLRNWECFEHKERQVQPNSAWLFNAIANKHADAMDNFPAPNVLPRESGDEPEADKLSSIIPVVLEHCNFEQVYSDMWQDKLKSGTGIYGIYWDPSKLNGLGDIAIKNIDILSIFWEPGITDIQASKNIFHVELVDNKMLNQKYPETVNRLGGNIVDVKEYAHDDSIKTDGKSCVIDWYYKRMVNGKVVLHYCKYVNDIVLYASENEPQYTERGYYDHGKYPFVFDTLYTVPGSPAGFGFIDIGKDAQEYIDRMSQAILENALQRSRVRYFSRKGGGVNIEDFADLSKDIIEVEGGIADTLQPVQTFSLDGNVIEVYNQKIDELKEVTGNRDISTGGTTSGVTAASAIAAMQEAGSKLSRDNNKASFRAYREVISFVIELIRQFYAMPRAFRIMGERGAIEYITYTNQGIQAYPNGEAFGSDMGIRVPVFDIQVTVEKASPYSRMANNELMIQLWQMGVFNPNMADQSMMLLEAMDFDGKDKIMEKVSQAGGMLQQMMMMAQMLDSVIPQKAGQPSFSESLAMQYGITLPSAPDTAESPTSEPAATRKARERTANATAPR